jgi:predicted NBD/HSP70 family sugar kinase/biotin operon repressor
MIDDNLKLTASERQTFKLILDAGPISRVKIAKILNLTRPAVTVAVQQLQQKGYIIEVGKGDVKAGRREVLLSGNPQSGLFFAVHCALRYLTIGLINLNSTILHKVRIEIKANSHPDTVLGQAVDMIKEHIVEHNIDTGRLWGIGISLPGIIDYNKGMAVEQSITYWENFGIRDFLEQHFDCPIVIENDVKTLALAEFKFSTGLDVENMVCLWLEDGIGAGIFINGQLFRGHSASAGEIGFNEFILPPPNGKMLLINKKPRYLGDILSFSSIQSAIAKGLHEGWLSTLPTDATTEEFAKAVATNDPLAAHLFRTMGEVLGVICCNLIYTFNPQVLLLSGPIFRRLPGLADIIQKHLDNAYLRRPIEAVSLRISNLGEDGITIGGALLLQEYLFKKHE